MRKGTAMTNTVAYLRSIPYFSALDPEVMERIGRETLELSFAKGEVLFLEGEPCRGLYLVKSGRVRIFKSSPDGREQVLLIARPGDTFNDVPVFDGGPNPASASVLEPSTVYLLPKTTVLSLIAECPVAMVIIQQLSARLRHLSGMVESLSFRNVVSRVAKMLLDLAVEEGGPSPVPRLTQDEMAAMVGSVRDVIGRALKTLGKAGAIKIKRHRIMVVNADKLRGMI